MIRIDVTELKRGALRMRHASRRALGGLALRAAEHLAEEAELRTPIDTGLLRGSWSAAETGPLSAEARNRVHYASFVEFDTRHWISKNIVPGRRFMRDAMEEAETSLPGMAETHVRELIGEVFR
ncbi:MAG: HK97 gp10 family phage protein [Oscillospiraceae bacterium]|nr:HK97 gp10 family phage protein [Oscillospiraceae bacterium]